MKALALIILTFSFGCATQTERVSLKEVPAAQIGMGDDSHRQKADELGLSYVDYLHMVNTGKVKATKSHIIHYHKFERWLAAKTEKETASFQMELAEQTDTATN